MILVFKLWLVFVTILAVTPTRFKLYCRGLTRIRAGFCPYCYSSPPQPDCPVCEGDQAYWGKNVDDYKRQLWKRRWQEVFKVLK